MLPFCVSCLWDSDTLKEEGKGRIDEVKVIVGWFDRYPPGYYQARLDRVLIELEATPDQLSLHDDAAVALDRLHRDDEAIEMMARKKASMDRLEHTSDSKKALKDHRYRYLANLGTFYVHRWVSRSREARNADLSDLQTAENLIAAAIQENPEAHFGREKYQLLTIQWLQKGSTEELDGNDLKDPLDGETHQRENNPAALEGFLGMIKLGSAWESVDLMKTIAKIFSSERHSRLAHLASLRAGELEKNGRTSIHPHADLVYYRIPLGLHSYQKKQDEEWFGKAREAADQRQKSRWDYLHAGLANGRHPDTDPDFWEDWEEPKFPALPGLALHDLKSPEMLAKAILFASIGLLVLLWALSYYKRRQKNLTTNK